MRRVAAKFSGARSGEIRRVIDVCSEGVACPDYPLRFLVLHADESTLTSLTPERSDAHVVSPYLKVGDVVLCDPDRQVAVVLYRAGDQHHSLFLTNRCNSNCLMCSQPPTKHQDGWLVDQALEIVRHMLPSPNAIGITGGEPTLLGDDLARIANAVRHYHPQTGIEILTNGRLLGDAQFADPLLMKIPAGIGWLVPLYGHADFLHDFVVQAPGAFDETVAGLLNLRRHEQLIQLRIVLIRPVLEYLVPLCEFLARNLPFVHQVAFMACEPVGFAVANEEHCRVDLSEWSGALLAAAAALRRGNVRFTFMNMPLCAMPSELWPHAERSISDWKNVYSSECADCTVKAECCGLFAWYQSGWPPAPVRAIERSVV